MAHFFRETVLADLREFLSGVQAPTLVLQRANGPIVSPGMGRYVADHIADARYVEIEGTDHMWFSEHGDDVLDEIEEFLTGCSRADPDRRLLTVLFTDIVGSTAMAVGARETPPVGCARSARHRSFGWSWSLRWSGDRRDR